MPFSVLAVDQESQTPLEGAQVTVEIISKTDSFGQAYFGTERPALDIVLSVEKEGYGSYLRQPYTVAPRSVIPIGLSKLVVPPTPPQPPQPPPSDLLNIEIQGAFFHVGGQPWTAIGSSDFALMARWANGEDISDTLQQRKDAGINIVRVWTMFDIPGIGTWTTISYNLMPAFVDLCASYGLYVEFTAYTGINDPNHWNNLIQWALRCDPYPLLELVNELDQNTNEPDFAGRSFDSNFLNLFQQAPAPLLSSHGSNGAEHAPVRPWWSYETMHFNDANEWWRKTGHNAMECSEGAEGLAPSHVPIFADENTRATDRDSNTRHYYDAAAGAALLCAGSTFHSVSGKQGRNWSPDELSCVQAAVAGARSVNLNYQVGSYRHASELEGPDSEEPNGYLRVYARRLSDNSEQVVRIRK